MTSSKLITVEQMATKKAAEPLAKKVKKDGIAPFNSGSGWTGLPSNSFTQHTTPLPPTFMKSFPISTGGSRNLWQTKVCHVSTASAEQRFQKGFRVEQCC